MSSADLAVNARPASASARALGLFQRLVQRAQSWWPKRGTMARRFVLWTGASIAVAVGAVCLVLYFALQTEVNWIADQVLVKRMETMRSLVQSDDERDYWLGHEVSEDMSGPRRVFIRVLAPDGSTIIETPDMTKVAPPSLFAPSGADFVTGDIYGEGHHRFRALSSVATWMEGRTPQTIHLQVALETTLDDLVLARYRIWLVAIATIGVVLGLLASAMIATYLFRPMRDLAGQIATVHVETLGKRIGHDRLSGELRLLSDQFNMVLERLDEAYRGLSQYADNVAHELRTPINKMMMRLELAAVRADAKGLNAETIYESLEDSRRLAQMVERLLFLARAANKQVTLEVTQIDVARELRAIGDYFEASASDVDITFEVQVPENLVISADRVLFQRCISNLVSNALFATPVDGAVRISAHAEGGFAVVEVADTGVGIAPEDAKRVFERFYRADPARKNDSGHSGLGLPLVKAIVQAHGGRITLVSEVGRGTKVTLWFPADVHSSAALSPPEESLASV